MIRTSTLALYHPNQRLQSSPGLSAAISRSAAACDLCAAGTGEGVAA